MKGDSGQRLDTLVPLESELSPTGTHIIAQKYQDLMENRSSFRLASKLGGLAVRPQEGRGVRTRVLLRSSNQAGTSRPAVRSSLRRER